jgi:hypothetical protein
VEEIEAALSGGAEIIDVKEPALGALGAAAREVVESAAARVPPDVPLSVALGDPQSEAEVVALVRRLMPRRRAGEVFLKMGFAGSDTESQAARLLAAAVATARDAGPAGMVAVAYADWARAHAPAPLSVVDVAERTGAIGVLLDTFEKDGRDLFASMSLEALTLWIEEARSAGLRVAVAGSLGAREIALLDGSPPDVVGVRGAACEGGRMGCVSETRVRALRVAAEKVGAATPAAPAKRQMIAPLTLT